MSAKDKRIQILNLQDHYCLACKHRTASHAYCIRNCNVGYRIHKLGLELFPPENCYRQKSEKKWDSLCEEAVTMRANGVSLSKIATILGCHASTIREQMKRRDLL
ncbi:zinc-finger domain-containing protein [Bacillus cereus group sp. BfR-BA-01349]|uniref:zinc-finger domain-containing protein n=1 Tax=Bacillus cereus group sp. BfR-BA-01349 TaxID=2920312 RepID=UPI001F56CEE3